MYLYFAMFSNWSEATLGKWLFPKRKNCVQLGCSATPLSSPWPLHGCACCSLHDIFTKVNKAHHHGDGLGKYPCSNPRCSMYHSLQHEIHGARWCACDPPYLSRTGKVTNPANHLPTYLPILFSDSLSSCHQYSVIMHATGNYVSTEYKEGKMAHHAYVINVRKEMLDRTRPIFNSLPPPTRRSAHRTILIHKAVTRSSFSIVLQIRAVTLSLFFLPSLIL